MNFFSGKTIFIFSPQPWSYLQLSKHHYARALARYGRVVYFSPPRFGMLPKVEGHHQHDSLQVVVLTMPLPPVVRVRLPLLYQKLFKYFFQFFFEKRLPVADVVLDFGCYQLFNSLNVFSAPVRILFPVDDFANLPPDTRGANLVLTVSNVIQKKFEGARCFWINHGLSEEFMNSAVVDAQWKRSDKIRIGCSGNLFIRFLDYKILQQIISEHCDVEFHFFGSMQQDPNVEWHPMWHEFLRQAANVRLHGLLSPAQLAEHYLHMDAFVLAYKPDYINYHGENSHKVLEYLSTGRVVISSFLIAYEQSSLLCMAPRDRNEVLPILMREVLRNLDHWNSQVSIRARQAFAFSNTYDRHVNHISALLENGETSITQ